MHYSIGFFRLQKVNARFLFIKFCLWMGAHQTLYIIINLCCIYCQHYITSLAMRSTHSLMALVSDKLWLASSCLVCLLHLSLCSASCQEQAKTYHVILDTIPPGLPHTSVCLAPSASNVVQHLTHCISFMFQHVKPS